MITQKYLLPAIILALAVSATPVEAFPEVAGCRGGGCREHRSPGPYGSGATPGWN